MPHASVTIEAAVIDSVPRELISLLVELAVIYCISIVIKPLDEGDVDLP